ncbi:CvpA family protein [Pseudomonadota bacterium]
MSGIDYAILGIITLSAAIGVWRGFVREALSLAIWVSAFWLAYAGAGVVEVHLDGWIADQSLRLVAAFILLFLCVHIAGFVISRLLSTLIRSIGLKGVDRVAGAAFGIVRGAVVIAAIILVAGLTPVIDEPLWKESFMIVVIEDALKWVEQYYPLASVSESLANVASTRS